jgi:hypothetical protein
MLINLACFAPLFWFARIVSYGRSPYQSLFILKPFTVTINDLCHDSHVCFLLFSLLFLRHLSVDFIRHSRSSDVMFCWLVYCFTSFAPLSCFPQLFPWFYDYCTCFLLSVTSSLTSLIFAPVGYKSREVFLSLCFFCTAYRAATTVTTILHKQYISSWSVNLLSNQVY